MRDLELKILKEFDDLQDYLLLWGDIVDKKIVEILNANSLGNEIKIFPISRLKEKKSFLSKALWRNKNYINPILEVEDKIGTRVVLLKSDDIKPASDFLLNSKNWKAKITKDLRASIEGKPKEFDYQSMHLVVCPNPNDKRFKKKIIPLLTCEIQIRTLLQHAFAEVSHDSTYKGLYTNDVEIIRNLAKSMALMEATDDYFCAIFKMMTDGRKKYKNYINELTTIFLKYKPKYKKENLDVELTGIIFELLKERDVSITDIQEFTKKNEAEIGEAIKRNNTSLFQQPVILLIRYYMSKSKSFLREKWAFSDESLNEVFNGFGFSTSSE